jgi:hypothetical protein
MNTHSSLAPSYPLDFRTFAFSPSVWVCRKSEFRIPNTSIHCDARKLFERECSDCVSDQLGTLQERNFKIRWPGWKFGIHFRMIQDSVELAVMTSRCIEIVEQGGLNFIRVAQFGSRGKSLCSGTGAECT